MRPKRANGQGNDGRLSYADAKSLARDDDPAVRARLAQRSDVRPEILYYLAEDEAPEVRRCIAANLCTPSQADLILARDRDEIVRRQLADKIGRLWPELSSDARAEAGRNLEQALRILAQDQAMRVREILAETLKELTSVPPAVIQRLAADTEAPVACPVLEFSPLLSDQDLLRLIAEHSGSERLQAVARRRGLGSDIADAIVETDDQPAISALLGNHSAQIREETLDQLVEASAEVVAWQAPLVGRPKLSQQSLRRLAQLVTANLLADLKARQDLDRKTADIVAEEVSRRLENGGVDQTAERAAEEAGLDPRTRARQLLLAGSLDESALKSALRAGEREFLRHALAFRSDLPIEVVEGILGAGSAKGVTALAWKAELSMRFAHELQLRLGGLAPHEALKPRGGTDYPMSVEEMAWQLEFFGTLATG